MPSVLFLGTTTEDSYNTGLAVGIEIGVASTVGLVIVVVVVACLCKRRCLHCTGVSGMSVCLVGWLVGFVLFGFVYLFVLCYFLLFCFLFLEFSG